MPGGAAHSPALPSVPGPAGLPRRACKVAKAPLSGGKLLDFSRDALILPPRAA